MCLNGNVGFDFAVFFFLKRGRIMGLSAIQSVCYICLLSVLYVVALTSPRSGEQLYVARRV